MPRLSSEPILEWGGGVSLMFEILLLRPNWGHMRRLTAQMFRRRDPTADLAPPYFVRANDLRFDNGRHYLASIDEN